MRFGKRRHNQVGQPLVRILLTHITGFIKLVEIMVRCAAQCTQLVIGHTADRNIRAGMDADIRVAFGIAGTHIKHGPSGIVAVDPDCTSVHNRTAAVGAPHPAPVKPLSFLLFIHSSILPPRKTKSRKNCVKTYSTNDHCMDSSSLPAIIFNCLRYCGLAQCANP